MLSAVFDSREMSVDDKGSTRRGRVKSWYARNTMIWEPSIMTKNSHDKTEPTDTDKKQTNKKHPKNTHTKQQQNNNNNNTRLPPA